MPATQQQNAVIAAATAVTSAFRQLSSTDQQALYSESSLVAAIFTLEKVLAAHAKQQQEAGAF